MARHPQSLAELASRAEAVHREARKLIAELRERTEQSVVLIERTNELIENDWRRIRGTDQATSVVPARANLGG